MQNPISKKTFATTETFNNNVVVLGSIIGNTDAISLQGVPINNATPNEDEVLIYQSGEWVPAVPNANAESLQSEPISTSTPNEDDVLTYKAGEWVPQGNLTLADINANNICANTTQTDILEPKNNGNITLMGDLCVDNVLFTGNIAGKSPINILDELNITSAGSRITFEENINIGTDASSENSLPQTGIGGNVYVTSFGSLQKIDGTTNGVITTIGGFGLGIPITYSPETGLIYVGDLNSVKIVDTATDTLTTTIGGFSVVWAIAVKPDGSTLYVGNRDASTVSVVDTTTNMITSTIVMGGATSNGVMWLKVSPDGSRLYVTGQTGLSIVNTSTNTIIATPASSSPRGIDFSLDGTIGYVCANGSNTIQVVDVATNSVTTSFGAGGSPWGCAVNKDGSKLYVTNIGSSTVNVYSLPGNTLLTNVTVGGNSQGVDALDDKIYVTSVTEDRTYIINALTDTVITNVAGGSNTRRVVTTQDTRAYISNNTISIGNYTLCDATNGIALGNGAVTGGTTRSFALNVNDDSINTSGAVPYLQCVINGDNREIPLAVVSGLDPDINANSICANIIYTGNLSGKSPINVLDELNITSIASKITFEDGIEIGTNAVASDPMSIVIGEGAQAVNGGSNNIAIGVGALARGNQGNQICIGTNARTRTGASWGSNAVAIGNGAYVRQNLGVAIGAAEASGDGAISIGNGANTNNSSRSIALGYSAACSGSSYQYEQISIGNGSDTTKEGGIAIGRLAASYAAHGISIGTNAVVTNFTGDPINAYGTGSVCIGENAETNLPNSVIIGKNCGGTGSPGYNMTSGSGQNIVIGYNSGAAMRCRFGNIVIGSNTGNGVGGTGEFPGYGGNPLGCNNVVIGPSINAGGGWDRGHVAIGHVVTMGGAGGRSYSVAIGRNVTNTRNTGVAIGVNSVCSGDNHFVLGGTNITSLRCNVTGITAISDERDKCNVEPFFEGIDFIKQLNPVKFNLDPRGNYPDNNFVSDGSKCDNTPRVGFLAQEVKQVQVDGNCDFLNIVIDEATEEVNGILEDGNVISGNIDTYRINLDHLHPVYINAFKNLIQVNSDQGNIIANLEARITALESA